MRGERVLAGRCVREKGKQGSKVERGQVRGSLGGRERGRKGESRGEASTRDGGSGRRYPGPAGGGTHAGVAASMWAEGDAASTSPPASFLSAVLPVTPTLYRLPGDEGRLKVQR